LPYRKLYSRRQSAPFFLPRAWYISDAEDLSWVSKDGIYIKVTERLLKDRIRGLIISHGPNFVHDLQAKYTIIVAEGLAPEMERFVVIKELMHCYLGPDGGVWATDSAISLESHMRAFFGNSFTIRSLAADAEVKALWMALGVLTPETNRLQLREAVLAKAKSYEDVASELMVPLHTAKALLSERFEDEIAHILK
jgi:hypothetical protein